MTRGLSKYFDYIRTEIKTEKRINYTYFKMKKLMNTQ